MIFMGSYDRVPFLFSLLFRPPPSPLPCVLEQEEGKGRRKRRA